MACNAFLSRLAEIWGVRAPQPHSPQLAVVGFIFKQMNWNFNARVKNKTTNPKWLGGNKDKQQDNSWSKFAKNWEPKQPPL